MWRHVTLRLNTESPVETKRLKNTGLKKQKTNVSTNQSRQIKNHPIKKCFNIYSAILANVCSPLTAISIDSHFLSAITLILLKDMFEY